MSQTSPSTGIQPANSLISTSGGGGGGGGGLCFLGETIVGLDHLRRPIETCQIGEATHAFQNGQQGICEITNVMWGWADGVLRIVLKTDERTIVLWPVPEHRFYIGNGEFRPIYEFAEGDWIKAPDLRFAAQVVESRVVVFDKPVKKWNLTTEWGTYWAGGVPVSNAKPIIE